MNRPPTLKTIAEAAGVSRMTVSLALRNQPGIPVKTRRRIQRIAERLGYRPNPLISTLMRHMRSRQPVAYTTTIAFVTSFSTAEGWQKRPLFVRYYDGIRERAKALGYELEEFWLREPGMTGRRMSEILWARSIHGVILGPLPVPRGHVTLEWPKFAVATVGYSVWRPAVHRAVNHQTHSLMLAIRQVKRLGYQRVGLALESEVDVRADNNFTGGFWAYQMKLPADRRIPPLIIADWNERQFGKWFRAHRPDVVLTVDVRVRDWLRGLGQRVPGDVGLASLEWSDLKRGWAGVRQNGRLIGAAAVDLVVEQLEHNERGIPRHPKVVLLEGEWVAGSTVVDQNRPRRKRKS